MKNTTSYTPGPWKINNNIGRKSELGVVADKAPCIICCMGNAKEWPDEAKANAQLIAAAPELLAALDHCVALIEVYQRDAAKFIPKQTKAAADQARAAIAKAQGGDK